MVFLYIIISNVKLCMNDTVSSMMSSLLSRKNEKYNLLKSFFILSLLEEHKSCILIFQRASADKNRFSEDFFRPVNISFIIGGLLIQITISMQDKYKLLFSFRCFYHLLVIFFLGLTKIKFEYLIL